MCTGGSEAVLDCQLAQLIVVSARIVEDWRFLPHVARTISDTDRLNLKDEPVRGSTRKSLLTHMYPDTSDIL